MHGNFRSVTRFSKIVGVAHLFKTLTSPFLEVLLHQNDVDNLIVLTDAKFDSDNHRKYE